MIPAEAVDGRRLGINVVAGVLTWWMDKDDGGSSILESAISGLCVTLRNVVVGKKRST